MPFGEEPEDTFSRVEEDGRWDRATRAQPPRASRPAAGSVAFQQAEGLTHTPLGFAVTGCHGGSAIRKAPHAQSFGAGDPGFPIPTLPPSGSVNLHELLNFSKASVSQTVKMGRMLPAYGPCEHLMRSL